MAKKRQTKPATSYVRRLIEDEYVQRQMQEAASGLRSAYSRARKRPAEAPEDKKLYDNVRQAAIAIRNAVTAIKRRPEPPKPKHRVRKVVAVVVVVGGSALLIGKRGQGTQGDSGTDSGSALAANDGSERIPEAETAPGPTSD